MADGYRLWKNSITGVVYRVATDAQSKIAVSGDVLAIDMYFSGPITLADTSELRAWLNSIPSP